MMPACSHTGTPRHFHCSTTSGTACLMIARTRASVSPRQSPSSLILPSISREGESPAFSVAAVFLAAIVAFFMSKLRSHTQPTPPFGGIWQHEHIQAGEQQKDQRKQRQQPNPEDLYPLHHRDDIDDDGQCEGDRQPAVDLPN